MSYFRSVILNNRKLFPTKLVTTFVRQAPPAATTSGVHLYRTFSFFNRPILPPVGSQFINTKGYHFYASNDHDIDTPKSLDDLLDRLNGLDQGIRVKSAQNPRWNIIEDDKALYLYRDMSGLDKKDVTQFVEFPRGVESFFGYRMNDFGSVLIYRGQYPPAILGIEHVGVFGPPNPEGKKGLIVGDEKYIFFIQLPGRFLKTFEIKMVEENQVLKITVPKVKQESIPGICYNWKRNFYGSIKEDK